MINGNQNGKAFYLSKTFWVNLIALIAIVLQSKFGYVSSPENQMAILGVINVILRIVTKKPIVWEAE